MTSTRIYVVRMVQIWKATKPNKVNAYKNKNQRLNTNCHCQSVRHSVNIKWCFQLDLAFLHPRCFCIAYQYFL